MILAALMIMTCGMIAQNRFSFGLVGTRFANLGSEHKLTGIDNPFDYGLVLGCAINKEISVGFIGEYLNENMKNSIGEEKDFRTHLSAYFTPFTSRTIRPYFSAGLVYTIRNNTYTLINTEETKGIFDGRLGVGLDYNLMQNIYLNLDAGLYSDGLNIVGWSSSVGLRINPHIF